MRSIDQSQKAELLKLSMEGATLLGCLSQEISKKRRLSIKPILSNEVAGICSESFSAGEMLFGDNLQEKIKATKSAANLLKDFGASSYRGRRDAPYSLNGNNRSLNFRAPFNRGGFYNQHQGRGMNRGRSNSMLNQGQNYQQQNYQQHSYQQRK